MKMTGKPNISGLKVSPTIKKKNIMKIRKVHKVLDYKAVQERKDMVENRLVRKIF